MVQKNSLVTLKQKPVLYLTNRLLTTLSLLVLLSYRLVNVLLLVIIRVPRLHHRNLLLLSSIGHLDLLNNLLILKIYRVHLSRHLQLILSTLLGQRHTPVNIIPLLLLNLKQIHRKYLLPTNPLLRRVLQHRLQ